MPSSPGMTMSLNRRSNGSAASAATAASPSGTCVTAWPDRASARSTKAPTDASSSARRIFATASAPAAAGEGHDNARRGLRRLRDAGMEGNALVGLQPFRRSRDDHVLKIVLAMVTQDDDQLRH